jgi:hypothetical protein
VFWRRQGEHHFVIEERLVLPALSHDDAGWGRDALVALGGALISAEAGD